MRIEWKEDLNTEGWRHNDRGDWLHPSHGPTPDMLSVYLCQDPNNDYCMEEEYYVVALWVGDEFLTVIVELLKSDPDALIDKDMMVKKLLSHEKVHMIRGWILQTYRCTIDDEGLKCCNLRVSLPTNVEDEKWLTDVCRIAMRASLTVAMTERIGHWKVASI